MRKFFILFFLMVSPVSAGVYKWTDQNGVVHFGDRPVNQDEATELIIDTESRSGITNSSGNNKERARMTKELEEDRKSRQEKREKFQADKKKRKASCVQAKDRLRQYQEASGIYKLDKNGERVFYSNEERAAKEKKLNKVIAKNCR